MLPKDEATEPASSACYLSEVDPEFSGITRTSPAEAVSQWRKRERRRLIDIRLSIGAGARSSKAAALQRHLQELLGDVRNKVVGLYWPMQGEPDLRGVRTWLENEGGRCCLPVVIRSATPLEFHLWGPQTSLRKTKWGFAEPEASNKLEPDIILAPFVGIDTGGYRLGYGGGYYDRTLVALDKPATVIGVGFAEQSIATIYPQPHDVPTDWIVTDEAAIRGQHQRCSGGLAI